LKLLVLLAVGLRPRDLEKAPNIASLASEGSMATLVPPLPAVTCTVQASMLTGLEPRDHGVVGNGWYHRETSEIRFWLQSNALVGGDEVVDRLTRNGNVCAKLFWWFNMYSAAAISITPRPEYHADGGKKPGLYSNPAGLGDRLEEELGDFPLFSFWGPGAGIASTRWIVDSALAVTTQSDPDLMLVYLPHLDFDHQRYGPDDPRSRVAVSDLDAEAGRIIEGARAKGAGVMVVSEYGIEAVERPVFVNRVLAEEGLLEVHRTTHGDLLDGGASRAFAVCDHQLAHVYLNHGTDLEKVRGTLAALDGVEKVLDRQQQRQIGLDHERGGELVLIAEGGSWFPYHYWNDEERRPDFAPTVDIHRKPGYDPAELFVDPALKFPWLHVGGRLFQKRLGMRMLMDVVPTDPALVGGSHGRLPENPEVGPLLVRSWSGPEEPLPSTAVASEILARFNLA